MGPLGIDGAPDQDPKNLEQAGALCEEQTGAFEYHGALELDGAPDQEPIGHWSMGANK